MILISLYKITKFIANVLSRDNTIYIKVIVMNISNISSNISRRMIQRDNNNFSNNILIKTI